MVSICESFHVAGVPAGAILREMSDRALTTITGLRSLAMTVLLTGACQATPSGW